ncbi:TetR family transcriptional regulator [Microbacterium sp. A93]|uniref:TetR family transcriptional regulator n=1 Tax=unclassified Microbacterium TaxID=2609290 RepID=UPI003F42237A
MSASDTRHAIAEAAAQEILARGYAGASLSAIAARLNLTKGALVHHFPAKSTFASHLVGVVRAATQQAIDFSTSAYPDSGSRRLILYFMLMSRWRAHEAQYAAGMSLFSDKASPAFESGDVIDSWLALSIDALEASRKCGEIVTDISTQEAAELFLVTNLGAQIFSRYVRADLPGAAPLRFVLLSLRVVGDADVDVHAEEVLARFEGKLPDLAAGILA